MNANGERRRAERVPVWQAVRLAGEFESEIAMAVDVSMSGAGLTDCAPHRVGDRFDCVLGFSSQPSLPVACRVVWTALDETTGGASMGVLFEDVTQTRLERLRELLAWLSESDARAALDAAEAELELFSEPAKWWASANGIASAVAGKMSRPAGGQEPDVHFSRTQLSHESIARPKLRLLAIALGALAAAVAAAVIRAIWR